MSWITDFRDINSDDSYFKTYFPSVELRKYVAYYWVLKYPESAPHKAELMIPDGFEEIIFSYGGGYKRTPVLNQEPIQHLTESYVIGAKNMSVFCTRHTRLNMVGVKLLPQTLSMLGRFDASSTYNQTLGISNFNLPGLNELEDKLFHCKSEKALISQLNTGFEMLLKNLKLNPLLSFSVENIYRSRGRISISNITEKLNCHYRTLEKKFKLHIGMTPKQYAKNIRFSAAFFEMINRPEHFNIENYGYYDPSHFNKEFYFFTGLTPGQYKKAHCEHSSQVFKQSHAMTEGTELNEN